MTQTTMRRWEMDAVGRDRLTLREVPVPTPGPGELLVRVDAVSLNYRDKLVVETGMGLDLAFPFAPASDLAGTVVAPGDGARRFAAGDRVISTFAPGWIDGLPDGPSRTRPHRTLGGLCPGVLADYVAFPEDWFVRAPETLSPGEASTLPCAALTAWFALVENGRLRAGQTVLLEGTGGVSLAGLQIARAHGATAIVTSSGPDKLERVRALGADYGVDRTAGDWVEAVRAITGGRGVDHVLEVVGGANLEKACAVAAVGGHIAVIGILEGLTASASIADILLKQLIIRGVAVGHRRALADLVAAVDTAGIRPVIDRTYRFDELQAALDHLDRGPFGKVVIETS
ncbi:NADPH:quinone reductase-like Zn-dependent oxidoreductase [Amorphus suaedae]